MATDDKTIDQATESGSTPTDLMRMVEAMAGGDQQAMAAFYDATSRRAYGLALSLLKDPDQAQEVTLDVYLELWRKAGLYRPERGSPLAWLLTVTRSRVIDRLRKLKGEQRHRGDWPDAEPATAVSPYTLSRDDDQARAVVAVLEGLPPEQRQVIIMAFYQGLSHRQIAHQLGLPLGTVKTRIRTGMQRLEKPLAALWGEE